MSTSLIVMLAFMHAPVTSPHLSNRLFVSLRMILEACSNPAGSSGYCASQLFRHVCAFPSPGLPHTSSIQNVHLNALVGQHSIMQCLNAELDSPPWDWYNPGVPLIYLLAALLLQAALLLRATDLMEGAWWTNGSAMPGGGARKGLQHHRRHTIHCRMPQPRFKQGVLSLPCAFCKAFCEAGIGLGNCHFAVWAVVVHRCHTLPTLSRDRLQPQQTHTEVLTFKPSEGVYQDGSA